MASTSTERDDMPEEPETYDATEVDENKWGALRMIGLLALVAAFAGFVASLVSGRSVRGDLRLESPPWQ